MRNWRALTVAVLATVLALTVVIPGAGAADSSVGTGQGVTPKTIKLGLVQVDYSCIKDFVDFNRGDQEKTYQVFVGDLNKNGGILGRKVEGVFRSFCPVGNAQALSACTSFTDSKHHTEAVLRAARDFVDARADLQPEEKRSEMAAMRRRLYDCLDDNRNEVPLATVAAAVSPLAPEDFLEHVQNKANTGEYQLNDRFTPHRKTYIGLKRVKGKIGTVSLAFDVADVQAERVRYDPNSDSIILTSPSEQLKAAVQEHAPAPD